MKELSEGLLNYVIAVKEHTENYAQISSEVSLDVIRKIKGVKEQADA